MDTQREIQRERKKQIQGEKIEKEKSWKETEIGREIDSEKKR